MRKRDRIDRHSNIIEPRLVLFQAEEGGGAHVLQGSPTTRAPTCALIAILPSQSDARVFEVVPLCLYAPAPPAPERPLASHGYVEPGGGAARNPNPETHKMGVSLAIASVCLAMAMATPTHPRAPGGCGAANTTGFYRAAATILERPLRWS